MFGSLAISESAKQLLYPKASELIIGALCFFILFFFMYKWVIPRANKILEERRQKIQGDLEKAEQTRHEADQMLHQYRESLAGAREESNRIIEDARKIAEQLRQDMTRKAEQEYQAIVSKAQEEIRAERDRVFQELRGQVGELSLQLAGRVIGESLDRDRHLRLIDGYISELGSMSPANGNGHGESGGGSGGSGGSGSSGGGE